ncbi:MAG: metal-dependent hydrolase [Bacteroidetes bacterium]|nr:metal-dependent hydrolase [Bacteroidota bacterium]
MATIISHGLVALAIGASATTQQITSKVIVAGILLAMLPDADVISFSLGIPYGSPLGHRGITHSILFSIVIALVTSIIFFRDKQAGKQSVSFYVFLYLFICSISHGILDAFTSGGRGIGFFIPFINERYFFGSRPILVSPIGIENFFSSWGWAVIKSEMKYIMLPCVFYFIIIKSTSSILKFKS